MKSPDHYHGTDLLDVLVKHNVEFCSGNIMKYVFRYKEKDGLKDLYKARDYLNVLIAREELKPLELAGQQLQSSLLKTHQS